MAIAKFLDRRRFALRASGLWLHYAALQNVIPSFRWIWHPRPTPWHNPRKGRDQILPSGNTGVTLYKMCHRPVFGRPHEVPDGGGVGLPHGRVAVRQPGDERSQDLASVGL